jgi:hypothetical protein
MSSQAPEPKQADAPLELASYAASAVSFDDGVVWTWARVAGCQ